MGRDPQNNEAGGLTKAGSSKNKCISISFEDNVLLEELKVFKLEILYEKFHGAGITSDIIWELDDDILNDCELTKIEKLRYQKAAAKFKEFLNKGGDPNNENLLKLYINAGK